MEIELSKENKFTLEMKIDGDVSSPQPPQMRFSIIGESMTVSLNAKRIDNGVYEITVPALDGVLEAGTYDANVEVFIDGKYFVPLKENVILKKEPKPTVKISESVTAEPPAPTVKISKPVIRKTEETITIKK